MLLSNIVSLVRTRTNEPGAGLLSDAEIRRIVNEAERYITEEIVKRDRDYFERVITVNFAADQNRLRGVENGLHKRRIADVYWRNNGIDRWFPLKSRDKSEFRDPPEDATPIDGVGTPAWWVLSHNDLYIWPVPRQAGELRIRYVLPSVHLIEGAVQSWSVNPSGQSVLTADVAVGGIEDLSGRDPFTGGVVRLFGGEAANDQIEREVVESVYDGATITLTLSTAIPDAAPATEGSFGIVPVVPRDHIQAYVHYVGRELYVVQRNIEMARWYDRQLTGAIIGIVEAITGRKRGVPDGIRYVHDPIYDAWGA